MTLVIESEIFFSFIKIPSEIQFNWKSSLQKLHNQPQTGGMPNQ